MKVEGKTILITGGTSGIGLEFARQLLAKRNTVIITGQNEQRLQAAKAALQGVNTYLSDATKPEDMQALRRAITEKFPNFDTLINNAGIMRNLNLNDPRSSEDTTRELVVNLISPVQMVQEFLPLLKSRPNALIVNVSSALAFVPFPLSPVYSSAKAGMHAFTRCLRVQLKDSEIRVVELAPPLVSTNLARGEFEAEMKGQKYMAVDALVRQAIAGIEAGKQEIRPGVSNILYFMSRVIPSLPFGQMAKMVRTSS